MPGGHAAMRGSVAWEALRLLVLAYAWPLRRQRGHGADDA